MADINQTKKNQTKKDLSPPARHHADARRRAPHPAFEQPARQDRHTRHDTEDLHDLTWLTHDNPNLADDIAAHVDTVYGLSPGTVPLIDSMVGRGENPRFVLNTALKKERERHHLDVELGADL